MSSQSAAGRRRSNNRQYSAEDQALNMISKEAEARLAAKRAARAEAREIRMKEIEKQQKKSEETQDKVYELTSDHAAAKVRQQLSGSRRGSTESTDSGPDIKDVDYKKKAIKLAEVRELEEKYKAAMMTSAQLDNEKQSLVYQVELLKDQLEEQDEGYTELQREFKDKCRECDFQKRDLKSMEHELDILKQQLAIKDRLIEESGFVIVSNESGEPVLEKQSEQSASSNGPLPTGAILVSPETRNLLEKAGGTTLDDKIKSFAAERESLHKEIKTLKDELEDHQFSAKKGENGSGVSQMNGPEMQLYEIQRVKGEASKQIHDYKFKLQKAEQDIATLEGMVTRLEAQVKRYKSDAERAEGMEDELKQEKRKLQKELREASAQMEELQNQNKHLTTRLERIKQTRAALGIQ
ncbi:leucine-rich repeat flightless-interacting protein 2 isoform X4 [Aplysia californica]|uniref:Leucine-rich repeat flightless-interacting protein 2 isoform X4 n=1 Tax=Aplysia californica TaxID=6500 RepID=A0ABM1A185_APLCA|nr:leucine-rich repeat flightless-interacting protein 2 isoform X4 [Aplysia californica]